MAEGMAGLRFGLACDGAGVHDDRISLFRRAYLAACLLERKRDRIRLDPVHAAAQIDEGYHRCFLAHLPPSERMLAVAFLCLVALMRPLLGIRLRTLRLPPLEDVPECLFILFGEVVRHGHTHDDDK